MELKFCGDLLYFNVRGISNKPSYQRLLVTYIFISSCIVSQITRKLVFC